MKSFSRYLEELYKPKGLDKLRSNLKKQVTDVDARDPSWQYSLDDIFKNYGFNRLGSGKYGSVFGNKKYPFVVKVFMKDSAYQRWISFCLKNRGNKYLPKIRGKVVKVTKLVYAIRLEKLTPYSGAGDSPFMKAYSEWKKDNSYRTGEEDLDVILDHFSKNKKLLDLHGENMMMRGNQLVVIDPYYNFYDVKAKSYTINPHEIDTSIF